MMSPSVIYFKCCKSVQRGVNILFRAFGLSILISGIGALGRKAVGKGYDEHIKVAIRKSRPVALLRALIHVAPIGVALWEIILNWNTYFVGASIYNLAYYQFAAKAHEIIAQASIAAMVLSYVTYELSFGQGLPFGAISCGLQVPQASYLWSREFWGAVSSKQLALRRRLCLVAVIILASILGVTVGPSSAVLLVPRLAYWPAGSTDVWINATSQDVWPERVNGSHVPASCGMIDLSKSNNGCPSDEWLAIERILTLTNYSIPANNLGFSGLAPPESVEVHGQRSIRELTIGIQMPINPGPGWADFLVTATSQQAVVADALTGAGLLWDVALRYPASRGHGSVLDKLDAVHSIHSGYYQPTAITSCGYDSIKGRNDSSPVAFPPPPGVLASMLDTSIFNNSIFSLHGSHAYLLPNKSKADILATASSSNEHRLHWMELPQSPFNGSSVGVVVFLPKLKGEETQVVLMCNIAAGWGSSTMNISSIGNARPVRSEVSKKARERWAEQHSTYNWTGHTNGNVISSPQGDVGLVRSKLFVLPLFPQRPLTISDDWADSLNPTLQQSNITVFERLMRSRATAQDREGPYLNSAIMQSTETILSGMVANGLSQIGISRQLQGQVRTAIEPDGNLGMDGDYWFAGKGNNVFQINTTEASKRHWIKLRIESHVQGYAYNIHSAPPKIAICILLIYCVAAVAHILYAGISGISSTCWDSVAELMALAVNSTPTTALRNTCAGISELSIFKLPVRALARGDTNGEGEHLELVFGDLDDKSTPFETIKTNRRYGTMPIKPTGKDE